MPTRRRLAVLAATLLSVALVAAACSSSSSKTGGGTATTTGAGTKFNTAATLTYYLDQEPSGNWNPNNADANNFDLITTMDRVLPSVFHLQPDFTTALDTNFMVSAEQTSDNPQVITYKINPKAVWSDGTPITADDFIYNWQTQNSDPAQKDTDGKAFNPASTAGYNLIQSVASVNNDPYTVAVTFKQPYPDWKGLFGADNPLVEAKFAKSVGWNTGFTDPTKIPAGGPFMIQSYTKGQSVTLVRNPKYWGPPANLAQVTFRYISDSAQFVPALQNGEVQAGYPTPQLDQLTQLKQLPNVKLDLRSGLEFEHLDFNQSNKWLKDDAVRAAIMKAVDRPGLIARTVGQILPSVKPLNDRMFVNNQPEYKDNSGGQYDKGDTAAAQKILTDAGYTLTNGTLTKGGQAVTMRITSTQGNALRSSEEQYVISQLAPLGIKVTEVDTAKLGHTLATGDFDMIIFAFVNTPFPTANDAIYGTKQGENYNNASDPAIDALIKQADATLDHAKLADLYNQIDALVWKDHWSLPLFQRPTLLVYDTKYVNMVNNATAEGPSYNMEDWGVKA